MTSLENLYMAIGELAYAVARSDGSVQREERQKFQDLIEKELRPDDHSFDVAAIIFHIMNKDKPTPETTYEWAMKEIRLNSHYLSPELKRTFIRVMEKVAVAFPPVTPGEKLIIDRFRSDIESINGDPVFYQKTP